MKTTDITIIIACLIMMAACSVQKRHYRKGYYVEWNKTNESFSRHHRQTENSIDLAESTKSDNEQADKKRNRNKLSNRSEFSTPHQLRTNSLNGPLLFYFKSSRQQRSSGNLNCKKIKNNYLTTSAKCKNGSSNCYKKDFEIILDNQPIEKEMNAVSALISGIISLFILLISLLFWGSGIGLLSTPFIILSGVFLFISHKKFKRNPTAYSNRRTYKAAIWVFSVSLAFAVFLLIYFIETFSIAGLSLI